MRCCVDISSVADNSERKAHGMTLDDLVTVIVLILYQH